MQLKKIRITLIILLLCIAKTQAQSNITFEKTDTARIDLNNLSVVTDKEIINYDKPLSALHLDYISDKDSVKFDVPESMMLNIDSLMNNWQSRTLLQMLESDSTIEAQPVNDSIYADRLDRLPSIIEMTFNDVTKQFIERYANRHRRLVSNMLGLSAFYMPMIESALDSYNMPQELKYLPIIESAFNPKAVSRVGAKGLWQFMFQTGKFYGLKANSYIDERFDPIKSTHAAIRYLRDLYKFFQSWDLAIAAYNCGPGNVKKAIIRSGGKTNFWQIYRYLPRETRGYIPAFIAANYIMNYYEEHGITPMQPTLPIATDTVHVNKNLHFSQVAELCNIELDAIRAMNPQYIRDIIPGKSETCVLRLPNETITSLLTLGDTVYKHKEEIFFPSTQLAQLEKGMKLNDGGRGTGKRHKVRNGETLSTIARKYGVSVKQIMRANGMKNTRIRAGRYIKIY
ncbi:MAG: transglycosylase SLT domain-containing protein [Bacteroidaceae bacterium]|nr:transglycosylase SLT domain-containing protein [Bacteroidaceae bacterium]